MNSTAIKLKGNVEIIVKRVKARIAAAITQAPGMCIGLGVGILTGTGLFVISRVFHGHISELFVNRMFVGSIFYILFYPYSAHIRKKRFSFIRSLGEGIFGFSTALFMTITGVAMPIILNNVLYRLPGNYLNWIAIAVLPIGYIAYRLKRSNQHGYGKVEVVVGVLAGFGATAKSKTDNRLAQVLGLFGAMYIVARGFNNIYEAKEKAKTTEQLLRELHQ